MSSGHLSAYQLTIEEGTPFAELHRSGRLKTPPSRLADTLYQITQEETEAAGLLTYEISNHARAGEEGRHNLLYWRYGEFAGIGPGAHGRLIVDGARTATAAERNPEQWFAAVAEHGHGRIAHEALSPSEQADEALLMGLRLREGIDPARLVAVGGVAPDRDTIGELVASGHLEVDPASGRIAATRKGRFILNALVLQLSSGFRPAPTPGSPDHPGRPGSPA
jgi:coproporphyrinogen III oxidase-like Fe-S oxidoreductase